MNTNSNDLSAREYRVLARKYRPQTFKDLIGQETLVKTLANALQYGRLAHAFVLTGVRGIGKTTTARIIAKGLNCVGADGNGGPTINPCGTCSNCLSITEDRHVDILEMDAASRTGVDDIREILDGVRYKPVGARYKIYIIDEVHMLSKNAFNALLKTLEEPPENVKFIFATTEIRKVPITVLSRCQRFDLRRISLEDLINLFSTICEKENIQADSEALRLIARAADGSARDGLSLLDQAMALTEDQISPELVQKMLGLGDKKELFDLFEEVMQGNVPEALSRVVNLNALGADPLQIAQDLLEITHLVTKFKVASKVVGEMVTDLEIERGNYLASKLPMVQLGRCWQMLLKGISEIQQATSQLAALEMVLIRLAYLAEPDKPDETAEKPNLDIKKKVNINQINDEETSKQEIVVLENPSNELNHPQTPGGLTFTDIVDLFEKKREGLIHSKLVTQARLFSVTPGRLEMMKTKEIDDKFAARISKLLGEWTGQDWMVSVVDREGDKTIQEQMLEKERCMKTEAAQDPLVARIIETFPGATIDTVRPLLDREFNCESGGVKDNKEESIDKE
ncbi:MAG: DNA polymerase III subunit gamma/tau [Thalassobaculaceae bacterium]|tara:strand:- start:2331 stop:4037 length:1707 start_codon:yes stop_codon:yes gene_type:complete